MPATGPAQAGRRLRVAFVVGRFPVLSEVFIINQIADLIDRGVDVEVFAFETGSVDHVSSRYHTYRMTALTHSLQAPVSKLRRLAQLPSVVIRLLRHRPSALARVLNFVRHGRTALSLRLIYAIAPFAGRTFDLVHCHFGDTAVRYLDIRAVLGSTAPIVTTFYGYDVSSIFRNHSKNFYDRLKSDGAWFYVMSENMRQRVVDHGFPPEKISVHPVSIDVNSYPFSERTCGPDEPIEILAVGRFVEKKGFDDLLRALALIREQSARRFACSIIGSGPLEADLRNQCRELGLDGSVHFLGSMAIEQIIGLMPKMHLLVAPSKTASYGDME